VSITAVYRLSSRRFRKTYSTLRHVTETGQNYTVTKRAHFVLLDLSQTITNLIFFFGGGVLNLQDLKMTDHTKNDWKMQALENDGPHISNKKAVLSHGVPRDVAVNFGT